METSEYRSLAITTNNEDPIVSAPQTKQTTLQKTPASFSNVVKSSLFPKKDQAIVYPSIEDVPIREYVIGTGSIVGPKNILFVSRMSGNRICIYLNSSQAVQEFVDKHKGITIKDVFIPARKLLLPAKRIIISNVAPCIPHLVIEEELRRAQVKVVTPISFIGAGIGLDEYKHVYSFRRQVYVATDQPEASIPSSLLISYQTEEFRIFLTDDRMKCFRCKEFGHIASKCTNVNQGPSTSTESEHLDMQTETEREHSTPAAPHELPTNVSDRTSQTSPTEPPQLPLVLGKDKPTVTIPEGAAEENKKSDGKRLYPESLQTSSETSSTYQDRNQTPARDATDPNPFIHPETSKNKPEMKSQRSDLPRKKAKREQQSSDDKYDSLARAWEDHSIETLSCIDFEQFLTEVKGNDNPAKIARKFTNDLKGLIYVIHTVIPYMDQRALRQRCLRLATTLKRCLPEDEAEELRSIRSSQTSPNRASSCESICSDTAQYY